MSVDGRVCAVGSANLDVTAGYWESELLLVVEEESIATGVEARFGELIATSGVAGVARVTCFPGACRVPTGTVGALAESGDRGRARDRPALGSSRPMR